MAVVTEEGNLQVALTGLANEFAASAARRSSRADQLSGDTQAMWAVALTTPTVLASTGIRLLSESGSGRTRVEANRPAESGVAEPVKA